MSNKIRVFVAIYTRPPFSTSSSSSNLSSPLSPSTAQQYHWGLWLEQKGSTGSGTSFDLEDSAAYSNVVNPFGWRLHIDEHQLPPPRMLGRIMIGKMVEGTSEADVGKILTQVKMPCEPGSQVANAFEWIKRVIQELQELGCAEAFCIVTFMQVALSYAVQWHGRKSGGDPEKVNYTCGRAFP